MSNSGTCRGLCETLVHALGISACCIQYPSHPEPSWPGTSRPELRASRRRSRRGEQSQGAPRGPGALPVLLAGGAELRKLPDFISIHPRLVCFALHIRYALHVRHRLQICPARSVPRVRRCVEPVRTHPGRHAARRRRRTRTSSSEAGRAVTRRGEYRGRVNGLTSREENLCTQY